MTLPPSMALVKLLKAILDPAYSGEASCVIMELRQSTSGLVVLVATVVSLAGAVLGSLVGAFVTLVPDS